MHFPPLLASRPPTLQIILADVVPAIFGIVCGIVLGISEPAYLVLSLLGVLGGYGAGLEHSSGSEAAARGAVGGVLFGVFIVATSEFSGTDPKAHLPDPPIILAAVTGIFGALLGAAGGATRARSIRRSARPGEPLSPA